MELPQVINDHNDYLHHLNHGITLLTGSGDEADYTSIVAQQLSFTNIERNRDLTVQIASDVFTEFSETFSVLLSSAFLANTAGGPAIDLSDQESARLVLNPDSADVTILDDDSRSPISPIEYVYKAFSLQWPLLDL